MKHLLFLAVVSASLISCGGNNKETVSTGDDLRGEISLSGAFALYPLAVQWADEFRRLHPHVRIDISAGGAGKGMTDALAKVVDLGMVSREVADVELAKGAVPFAVAKDAVVPTINAQNPQLDALLKRGLTRDEAIRLWIDGKQTTWGQIANTDDPTVITVYNRSDACGAAETWAVWLGKKQEDLQGTGVFGDPGVAAAVQKDPKGIGFNNIGYVYDANTLRPNPGLVVIPIDVDNSGAIEPEERFYDHRDSLVAAISGGRYPSPPARDLYLVSAGVPRKPAVVEFLRYILSQGQDANAGQGYIRLSDDKLQEGLNRLASGL